MKRGLGAALYTQLREDAMHVGLDRRLIDEELARDLLVGLAAGNELQYLSLSLRERLRILGGSHLAHQARRCFGGELHLACGSGLDRLTQLLGVGGLQEVADGPRAYRTGYGGILQHAG